MGYKDDMFDLLTKDTVKGSPPRTTHSSGPVRSVDLMAKKNATAHHTSMYHQVHPPFNIPIYRRGEPFQFVIEFKEHFKLNDKNLRVDLQTGANPLPGPGTLVQLQLSSGSGHAAGGKNWSAQVIDEKDRSIVVEVKPSCASPVGVWKMTIVTTQPSKQAYHVAQHCYIIFNPWCKDDAVYMENEAWRNEYVLNQSGMAFSNQFNNISCYNWNFGQFYPVTLPATMIALENLQTKIPNLSDPIQVIRAISRTGPKVLWGNWTGKYSDGVSPMDWTNSIAILRRFVRSRDKVKYAQCWVFGAVACSLARSLGIPCRVITNYASAHDIDKDLFAYTRWDRNGQPIIKDGWDSIWNFHVWDEAWMIRPDLPLGYGGWQAFDSCPQGEFSVEDRGKVIDKDETDVCGPVSVKAIKNGEIGFQYDAQFVYAEVNSDEKQFVQDENGKFKLTAHLPGGVGKLILTKAVGRETYEDVTNQYKFQESSPDERKSFYRAAKLVGKNVTDVKVPTAKQDEVYFDLMPIESVMVGKTFIISVAVENRSKKNCAIQVSLGADSVLYTGILYKHLNIGAKGAELYKSIFELAPEQLETVTVLIDPKMYLNNLSPTCHIKIFASALVNETHQVWVESDNVTVLQPKLTVEVPDKVKVGTPFNVSLKFTNPLKQELKNCSLKIDGNCFEEVLDVKFRNVGPNENVVHQMKLTPDYTGPCNISASFHSDLVSRIAGSKPTHVTE